MSRTTPRSHTSCSPHATWSFPRGFQVYKRDEFVGWILHFEPLAPTLPPPDMSGARKMRKIFSRIFRHQDQSRDLGVTRMSQYNPPTLTRYSPPMLSACMQSLQLAVSQGEGISPAYTPVLNDSSGIHILPDDVLQELFEWIIRSDPQPVKGRTLVINSAEFEPAQVMLAGVCRRWRVVVTSMSFLWNKFTLDAAHFGTQKVLAYKRLTSFIKYSRRMPITLNLASVDRENLYLSYPLMRVYGNLLDILVPHYRRWRDIHLVIDHDLSRKLTPMLTNPHGMESLEALTIDFRTRYWFDQDPHHIVASTFSSILRFPNLERLDFRTCSPWSYVPRKAEMPYWEKLTHLSVHVSYGLPHLVGLKMLQYLTSAEFIRMNVYVLRHGADGWTRDVLRAWGMMRRTLPEKIVLHRLKEFVFTVDHEEEADMRILDMIETPNLEDLALSLDPVSSYDGRELLRESKRLINGTPRLKTIYLRAWGGQYFELENVAEFIWACYEKKVTRIEVAGDHVYLIPGLCRWAGLEPGLEKILSYRTVQGMCKFDNLR
ncbi:hypothetical protein P691DRAFT_262212 [Macrolepiota fuliginosa MF-IS2]|uniref:F-box domain-containing protein n=1 Tax=Macrolepiota fuliginosa MF-IS2 TaxID=1400762 RepID=A0A9P5X9J3_9AGAR|nr:hypothetical protein P691DRAFT_262212 [Macrolepiota fuliginosa MF-IS2]